MTLRMSLDIEQSEYVMNINKRCIFQKLVLDVARKNLKSEFADNVHIYLQTIENTKLGPDRFAPTKALFEYLIEAKDWLLWNWLLDDPRFPRIVDEKLQTFMSGRATAQGNQLSRTQRHYFRLVHRTLGFGNYCHSVANKNVGCCNQRRTGEIRCALHIRKSQDALYYSEQVLHVRDLAKIVAEYI